MNGKIVRIGQVNTVDVAEVLARQASLEALMTEKMPKMALTYSFLLLLIF